MTADFAAWHDEHLLDHKRRLRAAMFVSLAIHGLLFAIFAAAPPEPMAIPPAVLAVDLVAIPRAVPAPAPPRPKAREPAPAPAPPPAAEPAPAPAPPPAAEPAPAPAPPPAAEPAPPPPPIAKAPVQVLPEETPGKIREAKPEPEVSKALPEKKPEPEVSKAVPEKKPEPAPRRRRGQPREQVSLEDLLAEAGPDEATSMLKRREEAADPEAESAGEPRPGIQVSPEQLAWNRKVEQQMSRRFVDLPRYRGRGLNVRFRVVVAADGSLRGEPTLLKTSGNLDFDRSALAAVFLGGPYPPPLNPGPVDLSFSSEDFAR